MINADALFLFLDDHRLKPRHSIRVSRRRTRRSTATRDTTSSTNAKPKTAKARRSANRWRSITDQSAQRSGWRSGTRNARTGRGRDDIEMANTNQRNVQNSLWLKKRFVIQGERGRELKFIDDLLLHARASIKTNRLIINQSVRTHFAHSPESIQDHWMLILSNNACGLSSAGRTSKCIATGALPPKGTAL